MKTFRSIRGIPHYIRGYSILRKEQRNSAVEFPFAKPFPCLYDYFAASGTSRGHYFYQDWLVAQKIFENQPELHVDIGSRVDGFVAHVAAFRNIEILDIRELSCGIEAIKYTQADLMGDLRQDLVDYCDSLSSLHAVEHFGLGRYGDPLDFEGYLKGLENMHSILRNGGKFYFSVPIGWQRIEYNAHRVFSVGHLLELFAGKYSIDSFSYVDDAGDLFQDVALDPHDVQRNFGCNYGCGIFEMTKQ
jgi:SAM-dependent methyltransferase